MNDFVQMDIFFFITSVAATLFAIILAIVGIYAILIIKKMNAISREAKNFVENVSKRGVESAELLRDKIDEILNQGGIVERIVATALGTILAKTFKSRDKMKRDVPKR